MSALGLLYKAADDQQQGGGNVLSTVGGIGAIGASGYLGHKAWQQQNIVDKNNKIVNKYNNLISKKNEEMNKILPNEPVKNMKDYNKPLNISNEASEKYKNLLMENSKLGEKAGKYTNIVNEAKGLRNLHGLGAALGIMGGAHMLMSNNNNNN